MTTFKISENSWHFRLLKKTSPAKAKGYLYFKTAGLCEYFWCVVLNALTFSVTQLSKLFILGIFAWVLIGTPITYMITGEGDGLVVMIVEGIALVIVAIAAFIVYCVKKFKKHDSMYGKMLNKKPKQDSLLVAYIKAKKEKFCPVVVFEKEKKL